MLIHTHSLVIAGLTLAKVSSAAQSVKITRGVGGSTSLRNVTSKDRARISTFGNTAALFGVAPAVNQDIAYTVEVLIGNQTYTLIVDTGSSNTWVGAGKPYDPSPMSVPDGRLVSVIYGSGSFSGVQYNDTLILGNATARGQSISVANHTQGFEGYDGILGLGPASLTAGTIAGSHTLVPTVMQTLESQGIIKQNLLGVYFQPLTGSNMTEANGELSLGGPDTTRYVGNMTFVNVTSRSPYSSYWGIDIDTLTHDIGANRTMLAHEVSAIVDTGTTLTYIPTAAMNTFLAASNGQLDPDATLPAFQTKPSANITFVISGSPLTLLPDQYLVPKEQYPLFGLDQTMYYAWFSDGGADGTINFIIGQKFLEHFYSVYDTTNNRVGFASAAPRNTTRKFRADTMTSTSSSPRAKAIPPEMLISALFILYSFLHI